MKVSEFNYKLSILKRGITKSDLRGEVIYFTPTEMRTNNGKIAISVPFESGFTCAVSGSYLCNYCASLPEDKDLKFECEDNVLTVKCGRSKSKLPFVDVELPAIEFEPTSSVPVSDEFFTALKNTFSIANKKESSDIYCSGVLIKDGCLYATNRYQAIQHTLSEDIADMLLLASLIKLMLDYQSVIKAIDVSDRYIKLSLNDGTTVASSNHIGSIEQYPSLEGILNYDSVVDAFSFAESPIAILDRFADCLFNFAPTDKKITMTAGVDELLVSAKTIHGALDDVLAGCMLQIESIEFNPVAFKTALYVVGGDYENIKYTIDVEGRKLFCSSNTATCVFAIDKVVSK